MVKPASYSLLALLACLLAAVAGVAQVSLPVRSNFSSDGVAGAPGGALEARSETHTPIEVEDNFLQVSGAQAHFEASNKMSESANAVLARDRIVSVPHFTSSFAFQEKTFPFTVVGQAPQKGQTTRIGTQIIPLSFYFEGYTDEQGNPIVLDMAPRIP